MLIGATDRGICFAQFGDSEEDLRKQLRAEYANAEIGPMQAPYHPDFSAWTGAIAPSRGRTANLNLPLDIRATAFQMRVWKYLQSIPSGDVQSYREVAAGIGRPAAARAVATAVARNPVALIIPCHRVIRDSGALEATAGASSAREPCWISNAQPDEAVLYRRMRGRAAVACLWRASAETPRFCEGCNYAGAALADSDFTNGVVIGTDFENATLTGSSFRGARLIAVNFDKADLRGTHFDSADCVACNFGGSRLEARPFPTCAWWRQTLRDSARSVEDAQLRQLLSGCISCNFSGGRLNARDLSGVALISVDFSRADLSGTNFTGAVLCWYQVTDAKRVAACDPMHDAITTGANFSNAQLCDNPLRRSGCVAAPSDVLKRSLGPKPSASPNSP